MNSTLRSFALVVGVAVSFLAGCATETRPSVEYVQDPTQPFASKGFTLLPPDGKAWMAGSMAYNTIGFVKIVADGRGGESSFAVLVESVQVDSRKFDLRTAQGLKGAAQSKWVIESHSYRNVQATFSDPYETQGTECASFEFSAEEINNPRASGRTLLLSGSGKFCRHPLSPDWAVISTFSERRFKDTPSMLEPAFIREADRSIESIRFVPIQ